MRIGGALTSCASSAARFFGAGVLSVLVVGFVLVWLAQHARPICREICPSLLSPPLKRPRRRRGAHVVVEAAVSPVVAVQPVYTRDGTRALGLISAVGIVVPSLLYQQARIHRTFETHVHEMPTIPWELFALAHAGACLTAAAIFPDLTNGLTARQRVSRLLVTRTATVLVTAYVVSTARHGISAKRMLAFMPTSAGASPGLTALGVATGMVPLKLSSWIRMCCAFHTTIFELAALPVFVTGMQITPTMRRRFPPWSIMRCLALAYGLNDLLLFGCTCVYLCLLPTAVETSGHPRLEMAARSDVAVVGTLYLAMRVHGPMQLLLAATLTPENRLRLASFLQARLTKPQAHHVHVDDDAPTEVEMKAPDRECVVCLDQEATHILAPCGHRCVCAACSANVNECPLCRTPIASVVSKVW